jgi:hypothetical protein
MNDLVTPFLAVFLSEYLGQEQESWRPEGLSEEQLLEVEADSYWCLCRLLEGIQDHYTDAQPGIQKAVFRIKEVVRCACVLVVDAADAGLVAPPCLRCSSSARTHGVAPSSSPLAGRPIWQAGLRRRLPPALLCNLPLRLLAAAAPQPHCPPPCLRRPPQG